MYNKNAQKIQGKICEIILLYIFSPWAAKSVGRRKFGINEAKMLSTFFIENSLFLTIPHTRVLAQSIIPGPENQF